MWQVRVDDHWLGFCVLSLIDKTAIFPLDDLMYNKKAALCHRPIIWIIESSMPTNAALVAAPIWKPRPAYWCCGSPIASRHSIPDLSDEPWLWQGLMRGVSKELRINCEALHFAYSLDEWFLAECAKWLAINRGWASLIPLLLTSTRLTKTYLKKQNTASVSLYLWCIHWLTSAVSLVC